MENPSGKRILMFCAPFFGYDRRLSRALEAAGYQVDLYDEKPGSGFLDKTCIRYNIGLYRPVIRRYIRWVIEANTDKRYDYVFVVKGEAINTEAIGLLRQAWPEAKFLLYLWDSVANIPECERRMALYDRVLTFDPKDAETYGILFRPLFYDMEYEAQPEQADYAYDFAFIGTAHTVRPRIVKRLAEDRVAKGKKAFAYLYLPHRLLFLYNKLLNRAYRDVKRSDIQFTPMTSGAIKDIYGKSKCILDVEHQKQRGLTMRTIELIGMQKKIITTNALVREYDFYNPKNICIIDREDPRVDEAFWDSAYEPIPERIQKNYSIDSFVKEVFGI